MPARRVPRILGTLLLRAIQGTMSATASQRTERLLDSETTINKASSGAYNYAGEAVSSALDVKMECAVFLVSADMRIGREMRVMDMHSTREFRSWRRQQKVCQRWWQAHVWRRAKKDAAPQKQKERPAPSTINSGRNCMKNAPNKCVVSNIPRGKWLSYQNPNKPPRPPEGK